MKPTPLVWSRSLAFPITVITVIKRVGLGLSQHF